MAIKVISATLTTTEFEMITETGDSVIIPQGHPKLRQLIDKVLLVVSLGNVAIINEEELESEDIYKNFEKESNALVRFFKVAKNKLTGLFKTEVEIHLDPVEASQQKSVEDILSQAKVAEGALPEDETTVVAVVDGVAIPGMEKLASHIQHSLSKRGSTEGIDNLLKRLSKIIHKRKHSVGDLLTFLEKADLPIADDGSIIIYKGLNHKCENLYVDSHTGKVFQKEGSLVFMEESLVDDNRLIECSSGLHVARKGYLRHFPTGEIFLAKVNPEDVIAVPSYDASKMRVCAYHLLFKLPKEDADAVRLSKEMEKGSIGSKMLTAAITGNHTGITSRVKIGGRLGTNLEIEGFTIPSETTKTEPKEEVPLIPDVEKVIDQVDDEAIKDKITAPPVKAADVMEAIKAAKGATKMNRSAEIRLLVEQYKSESDRNTKKDILLNIRDLKRISKKSWEYHGVSKEDAKRLTEQFKYL